jgi:peroxiredoxin
MNSTDIVVGGVLTMTRSQGLLVGKPAVPFALADVHGNTHRLEDYRGQWLLLVFHRHLA